MAERFVSIADTDPRVVRPSNEEQPGRFVSIKDTSDRIEQPGWGETIGKNLATIIPQAGQAIGGVVQAAEELTPGGALSAPLHAASILTSPLKHIGHPGLSEWLEKAGKAVEENVLPGLSIAAGEKALGIEKPLGATAGQFWADVADDWTPYIQQDKSAPWYSPGNLKYQVGGAAKSLAANIPWMIAGIVTRNPKIALTGMSAMSGAQQYSDIRNAAPNISAGKAGAAGLINAATEYLTEKIPIGHFLDTESTLARRYLMGTLTEVPGELVATTIENGIIDKATTNPNMTWGDFISALRDTAYQTIIQTPLQAGVSEGVIRWADRQKKSMESEKRTALQVLQDKIDNGEATAATAQAPREQTGAPVPTGHRAKPLPGYVLEGKDQLGAVIPLESLKTFRSAYAESPLAHGPSLESLDQFIAAKEREREDPLSNLKAKVDEGTLTLGDATAERNVITSANPENFDQANKIIVEGIATGKLKPAMLTPIAPGTPAVTPASSKNEPAPSLTTTVAAPGGIAGEAGGFVVPMAPAPEPVHHTGRRLIGRNFDGEDIFEGPDGKRSIFEKGIFIHESPTIDPANRDERYKTTREIEATAGQAASSSIAPVPTPAPERRNGTEKAAFVRRFVEVASAKQRMEGVKPDTVALVQQAETEWENRTNVPRETKPVIARPSPAKPVAKTPENLVTYLQTQGGVNFGPSYNLKELKQDSDIRRIARGTGMPLDEAAQMLNAEGFVSPDGQPWTADNLVETLKTGQGRNIFTPEKADAKIEQQLRRKEREWIADKLADLEAEGIDAAAIETSRGDVLAGFEEKIAGEGLVEGAADEALTELEDFFDSVTSETPPTKQDFIGKTDTAEIPGVSARETFDLTNPETNWGTLKIKPVKAKTGELYSVRRDATGHGSFADQLDDIKAGKITNRREPVKIGDTPAVLQKLGAEPLPLVITHGTIEKATTGKHGISFETLKQLPGQIADPVMVFDSATEAGSIVVMTELQQDGKTVVAAISLSSTIHGNQVNDISTVHPRNSEGHFINWINQGLLRYMNRSKSRAWSLRSGLQLPRGAAALRGQSGKKILFDSDLVKEKYSLPRAAAPAFYSHLSRIVEQKMSGKMSADQLRKMLKNNGVTDAETENVLGNVTGTVTKQDVLDEIKANTTEFRDVVLGGDGAASGEWAEYTEDDIEVHEREGKFISYVGEDYIGDFDSHEEAYNNAREAIGSAQETSPTHFSKYTEPGAVPGSYREMFVTTPGISAGDAKVIKAPSIEEQRAAREELHQLWMTPYNSRTQAQHDRVRELAPMVGGNDSIITDKHIPDSKAWQDGHSQYSSIQNPVVRIRFNDRQADGKRILFIEEMQGPSDANQEVMPAWLRKRIYDIGVKRILAYAKENGFDGVAWTPGEMQADRYDLSKKIDRVEYRPESKRLLAWEKDGLSSPRIDEKNITPEKLADYVGKDVAERLINNPTRKEMRKFLGGEEAVHEVSGLGLKVGGEGLKRLYDQTLPALFKKYGKEQVGQTDIGRDVYNPSDLEPDLAGNLEPAEGAKPSGREGLAVSFIPITDKTPVSYPAYAAGQKRTTPAPITLETVQQAFPGQRIERRGTTYTVTLKNGLTVKVTRNQEIIPEPDALMAGYGTSELEPGQYIDGMYVRDESMPEHYGRIRVTDKGGIVALHHESVHFLEDFGVISKREKGVLDRHIKREGAWDEKLNAEENRAAWLGNELNAPKTDKGIIARIWEKIREFVDRLVNAFGIRTVEGIKRGIKSGAIFGRAPEESGSAETERYSAQKNRHQEALPINQPLSPDLQNILSNMGKPDFSFNDDSTKNEGRWQIRDTSFFDPDGYYRAKEWQGVPKTEGVSYVIGKRMRRDAQEVQSIRFDKRLFTEDQAAKWWEANQKHFRKTPQEVFHEPPPDMGDPKKVKTWLKDQTDAIVKSLVHKLPSNQPALNWMERILKSPEWYDHPVISRIVKIFANDRSEIYHDYLHDLIDTGDGDTTVVDELKALKKSSPKDYALLGRLIDEGDTTWKRDKNKPLAEQLADFETYVRQQGAGDDLIKVWRNVRGSFDRSLDLMQQQMRELLAEIEGRGEFPLIEKGSIDETFQQTLRGALASMEEWRGFYAPRVRDEGNYIVQASRMENGERIYYRNHRASIYGAERLKRQLEHQGWSTKEITESKALPEDVQQKLRAIDVANAINAAMEKVKRGVADRGSEYGKLALKFNEDIVQEVSDMIKARGFRSSMIHRNEGAGVVKGYNEDLLERSLIYWNNTARGLAKAQTAAKAMKEFMGEIVDGKRIGGIDPVREPNAYQVAEQYIAEQLRNADATDRFIGLAKSVATFKYLGFNIRSLGVNLTAVLTTVPPAIHQYALGGKGSLAGINKAIAKAGWDYAQHMKGEKMTNAEEEAFMRQIKKLGYDDPQYTQEALGELRKAGGKVWSSLMDASMFMFGKSEQWNRGTTMLAAYRLAREQGSSNEAAIKLAHEASDRAHGVYGKATLPEWALGKGPTAKIGQMMYVYSKFGHNYVQMLYDLKFKKHDIKAFVWAGLSPLVLAGGAAFPFKDTLFGIYSYILSTFFKDDRDPEKWVYDSINRYMGGTGELIARHGVTGIMGADISSSLSVGIGIPKGLADLAGAVGGVASDVGQAFHYTKTRQFGKAAEKVLPTAAGNVVKAVRENREGVTTGRGNRVWDENGKPLRPTGAETALRTVGFGSSRQAVVTEKAYEKKDEAARYNDRKTDIYERFRAYLVHPDPAEHRAILATVKEFNADLREKDIRSVAPIKFSSMRAQATRMAHPSKRERQ